MQDTGGENLESQDLMRENLPYLGLCSGLILVVDPLQFPSIRQRLRGTRFEQHLPDEHPDSTTQAILGRLRNILNEKQTGAVALALVITKCDVLLESGLLSDANFWGRGNTDKRHDYSWDYHNDITGMFAAFMQENEPATYRSAINQFPVHAFFGVSATGTAEKDDEGRFASIEPKHVLQPIWWMLAITDMIRSSRLEW